MLKRLLQWIKNVNQSSSNEKDNQPLPSPEHKGRAVLGIVVGHTRASQGAELARPFRVSEYAYHSELAQIIKNISIKKDYPIEVKIYFRDVGGIAGAYSRAAADNCDAVVELHFNGFNGVVRGTVTLCSANDRDIEFATIYQKHMCKLFGREGMSRGVKAISRSDRGGFSVHSYPNGPNCLIEPVFGDVVDEAKMYVEKRYQYAEMILEAMKEWMTVKKMIA